MGMKLEVYMAAGYVGYGGKSAPFINSIIWSPVLESFTTFCRAN
jgi:hypothetical protein